ncbi:MAG TPA: nuclear transport factor 2 family protein [Mycobacterium sp.]|nr:nuclear transport factor 2 family protein [Mycobacterium sp.]
MTGAADELEAIRQLKARYCRFLDTKDLASWREVLTAGEKLDGVWQIKSLHLSRTILKMSGSDGD